MEIRDTFEDMIDPRWVITQQGNGSVYRRMGALNLTLAPDADSKTYHNAQITDYVPSERTFQMVPPLRLTVEALASPHPTNLHGTAGFGFWNHAFAPDQRGFGLPQTLWFFFSGAQSNMALARGVPGNGWKAATMHATRWQAKALLPLAPIAMPLMRVKALKNALWGIGQRALGVSEALLDAELLQAHHTYSIEWTRHNATFYVDDQRVHVAHQTPTRALGFIAWIDNQYAVVTPQGAFAMGATPIAQPQTLVLNRVEITHL